MVLSHGETLAMVSLLGVGSLVVRVARARDAMPVAAGIELFNADGGLAAQAEAGDDGVSILPDLLEGNYELVVQRQHYVPARGPVAVRRGRTGTAEVQLVGQGHLYGAVLDPEGGWLPATLVTLADETGSHCRGDQDRWGRRLPVPDHPGGFVHGLGGRPRSDQPSRSRSVPAPPPRPTSSWLPLSP